MSWSFNPFTGNLDLVGGGAVVFEGEVETFADLSETIGDPAVGASFLVRSSTGVWLVNRRQAGIWIRRNNTGVRATDWEYGGDYPVNSVNGQTGNVSLGSSDVAAEPIDYTVVTSATTLANGAKVAADTTAGAFTLTLPATPANGDTVSILDYAGTFDTNNLTIARNGSNIESLAEDMDCNIEDAAFSLVFVGSTVGWKVVPYFGNKTNFASPGPIGSSVANTGAFTNLSASAGTFTTLTAQGDGTNALVATFGAADSLNNEIQIWGNGANRNNVITATVAGLHFRVATGGAHCQLAVNATLNGFRTSSGGAFHWSNNASNANTGTTDLILARDDAGVMAQRNSTNPQTFRLYNTFTDASNHERGFMRWSSNNFDIGTEAAGTGSNREVRILAGTSTYRFATNNLAIFPGSLTLGQTSGLFWFGRGRMQANADGVIQMGNNAGDNFDRLQFGGTTNSFPALKRSSTALQVRLADDSAYTVLDAQLRAQGTAPATSGATGTAGDIRYDADYIYVCTAANTWKRVAIATW